MEKLSKNNLVKLVLAAVVVVLAVVLLVEVFRKPKDDRTDAGALAASTEGVAETEPSDEETKQAEEESDADRWDPSMEMTREEFFELEPYAKMVSKFEEALKNEDVDALIPLLSNATYEMYRNFREESYGVTLTRAEIESEWRDLFAWHLDYIKEQFVGEIQEVDIADIDECWRSSSADLMRAIDVKNYRQREAWYFKDYPNVEAYFMVSSGKLNIYGTEGSYLNYLSDCRIYFVYEDGEWKMCFWNPYYFSIIIVNLEETLEYFN